MKAFLGFLGYLTAFAIAGACLGVLLAALILLSGGAFAQAVAPVADTAPAWLSGIINVLWNALGLAGGTATATTVSGIVWHFWTAMKARATNEQADATAKVVDDGVLAAIATRLVPATAGTAATLPALDTAGLDEVVSFVREHFIGIGTAAPDSDLIRRLAKASLGRIILKLQGAIS